MMSDYIPTPTMGEILREEFMEPMNLSAYRLAQEIHVPVSRIQAILNSGRRVTVDTSLRLAKFFGVSDGAYLYCDYELDADIEQDQSWERMTHLLRRIDVSAEAAYADFREADDKLKNKPIMKMSVLTHRIMASIDYDGVAEKRRQNYLLLDKALGNKNGITLSLAADAVPMVYPFLTTDQQLRQRLIDNKVYVATYWPNVSDWVNTDSTEYTLTTQLLPLPIDQRYGEEDLKGIYELI